MPRPSRRTLRKIATTIGVLLVLGGIIGARSHWEITHTRLVTLDVTSPKITTGRPLRILQVTDVHDMPRSDQRAAIVEMARQQHPDLIAVTGDLESFYTTDLTRMDGFVADLASLHVPLYYVPGNHEDADTHAGAQAANVIAMVERHGGIALVNRHVAQDGPWGRLDVVGTDDYYTHHGDLPAALRGTRPDAYHLVLTHSPQVADDLATSTADLALCGHTHGGQVRVPGVGALYSPGGGFLPRYDKGLFHVGSSLLWVDSGAGQSLPLRLDDQSQISAVVVAHR